MERKYRGKQLKKDDAYIQFDFVPSDPSEDKPSGMRRIRQNSQSIYPTHFTTPPISPEDTDPFIYSGVMRARSLSKEEPGRETGKKKMFTRSDSLTGKRCVYNINFFIFFCFSLIFNSIPTLGSAIFKIHRFPIIVAHPWCCG